MAITFTSTQSGASADYMKYLYANPVKTDKYNTMTMLDFSLASGDVSFVKLNRGSYITISSTTYPNWFTGYIVNDPQLEFLGADKNGAAVWGYKYQATSDEVILNTNSLGIWKAFTNMTQGAILKALVNALMPGVFDLSQIQDGLTLPQYLPDPNKKFSDVVNEFAQAACYRFYARNHVLYFRSQDADPVPYTVNGSDKLFTPSDLNIKPSSDPIINDCLVIGAVEPQDYVTEYFVGDGVTGSFPLTSSVFGVESTLFLDDDFGGSSIDTSQKWTLYDTASNYFQVVNGFLNVLGGTGDMSQVHLDSISLIPLQANLRLTHGDYDFVNSASRGVNGIIGGLWTQAPNTAFTGCVFGMRVFNQTNLIPDSDLLNTGTLWSLVNASLPVVAGAGAVRGNAFRYTGTGAAGGFPNNDSGIINVTPLATYTLSGYIDATHVTAGNPIWAVFDTGVVTSYAQASQTIGANGRVTVTFTVPAGVTQVKVICDVANCTVASGQTLSFSNPQLELGSVATAYETNNTGNMDTQLMPVVNGVVDRTQFQVINFSKRYTLRTLLSFQRVHRTSRQYNYRKSNGTVGNYLAFTGLPDSVVATTYITEVDPVTGAITQENGFVQGGPSLIWTNTIPLTSSSLWANYVAAASNDLHCTITGITLSLPLQAALDIESASNQAAGFIRKQVGPNEVDGFDGLSPVATIVQSGGSSSGNTTLGTPQYNAGNPTLTFFKNSVNLTTTVPGVGDIIRLRYRRAGAALGRCRDQASVATEAANWGDTGVRSVTRNDLNPKPRNSSDCQAAAAAIVSENNYVHYEGTYKITSPYVAHEPMAGLFLSFTNMPSPYFNSASFSEMIQQVTTSLDAKSPEVFTHTISFGKQTDQRVRKYLAGLQQNPNANNTSLQDSTATPAYIPPSSVGLAFAPDVVAPTLVSVDSSNLNFNTNQAPPTGGGFEVRYTDDSWGCDAGKNLITRTTSQTFSVARNNRAKFCFIRAYDARNICQWSEDLTQWFKYTNMGSVTNSTQVNPDGTYSLISTCVAGSVSGNNAISLTTSTAASAGQAYAFTLSIQGVAGTKVGLWISDAGQTHYAVQQTVTLQDTHWHRYTVTGTMAAGATGNVRLIVVFDDATCLSKSFQVARASCELGSVETVYCKTAGSAYGALSRFPALLHVGLPLIPAAPTATINTTNVLNPVINVTMPTSMLDVWGVEIRASDNATVLFHQDLSASGYTPSVQVSNSSRNLSYYVYTYNLLGEYSAAYNATATYTAPTATSLVMADTETLSWSFTGNPTGFFVDADATDGTFTHIIWTVKGVGTSYTINGADFFPQRWFRVTPFDALGNGTATTLSHVYTPTGVVEFNANEVAVIPAPVTPTTDPTIPTPLSDYPREVISDGWGIYKTNRMRYY